MFNCKLFNSYPVTTKSQEILKKFSLLTFACKKRFICVYPNSSRMIKSGLNNGQSKTGAVIHSPLRPGFH